MIRCYNLLWYNYLHLSYVVVREKEFERHKPAAELVSLCLYLWFWQEIYHNPDLSCSAYPQNLGSIKCLADWWWITTQGVAITTTYVTKPSTSVIFECDALNLLVPRTPIILCVLTRDLYRTVCCYQRPLSYCVFFTRDLYRTVCSYQGPLLYCVLLPGTPIVLCVFTRGPTPTRDSPSLCHTWIKKKVWVGKNFEGTLEEVVVQVRL